MNDLSRVLQILLAGGVEFVLIGGGAAAAHGAARVTYDIDVVYRRTPENLQKLVDALAPHQPFLRGAPPDLPFLWDAETLRRGLNFTLTTDAGDLDLLGEVAGGGTYENLLSHSLELQVFGLRCSCLALPTLIAVKRAAGRPKDFEAIAELQALLEEREVFNEKRETL